MQNKTKYKKIAQWGNISEYKQISDRFLPAPDQLVTKSKLKKITISLNERSINFFKNQAIELNTSYQKMIRNLLDAYADKIEVTSQNVRKSR